MDRKEWAWAAGSAAAFMVLGYLTKASFDIVRGKAPADLSVMTSIVVFSAWVPVIWASSAAAFIAALRWILLHRLSCVAMAVPVLALGAGIDVAYNLALSVWALHRLVLIGPPVFQDGLLAVAVAAFSSLVAAPKGQLIPTAALLVADGWALSGLAPSTMFFPPDSLALRWLPALGVVYLAGVTVLVVQPLMRKGGPSGRPEPSPQPGAR